MEMLNEQSVLNFYLQELELDRIEFLKGRDRYKEQITRYVRLLRETDVIHDRIQVAKKLWKVLFEAAMSFVDPDKRGYDNLFKFFDEYVNFEELIFATDSFYRDHTLHCLWVYFLGEYIWRHEQFAPLVAPMGEKMAYIKAEYPALKRMSVLPLGDDFSYVINTLESILAAQKYEDSIRCVAALTHDLGYPLKKIAKINKSIRAILPYFSIENYDEFNFSYSPLQQRFISNFLELLSDSIGMQYSILMDDTTVDEATLSLLERIFGKEEKQTLEAVQLNEEVVRQLSPAELTRLKEALKEAVQLKQTIVKSRELQFRYAHDLETYQHGILSAFLLMKTVQAFTSFLLKYNDNLHILDIDYAEHYTKKTILTAISDHTSPGFQISKINDHSCFLTLIDELEEFSRISRADQNRQYINEFCSTNITMQDQVLQIDFIFDNTNIDNLDPELAFKGRCKRTLSLFNIRNLDERLKVRLRCIGRLPHNQNTYTLEIGRKYARILVNETPQNIPEYLKSTQFYTEEEYAAL